MLDKATDRSFYEHDVLAGNEGDLGSMTEVTTSIEDLQMVCKEQCHDSEGLSDLNLHSKRLPRVVDDMGFMANANNVLKQDDPMPKIEAEVSRSMNVDSVPSLSGSIDGSLDGKEGCAGETFSDLGMCHVAKGDLWSNVLCNPFGEGYQSKDTGHITVKVNKVTEESPCGQGDLVGEGGVSNDGVEVKKSLDDIHMCSKESHYDNKGLPYLVEFGIQQLPYGTDAMCLKTDGNHELENDGLLTNTRGEVSKPMHEDSVASISGNSIYVPFDGNAGQIGETSEHRTSIQKVSCGSQGGGILSCESWFCKESHGDDNHCSRMKVKTCEEDLQTCWMESCHENVALLDSGKHGTGKLPCDGDELRLITDANHDLEKDDFLPKIDVLVSCPVDETSVPSVYNSPINVPVDKKADWVGEISENSTYVEKLAHDLPGEIMLSCDSRVRTEATGDENQHFMMDIPKGLTASVCKAENTDSITSFDPCVELELPLQNGNKYVFSEFPPETDLASSSHSQPCEGEPCYNGREASAFFLGHQDSAGIGLESSDHLAQELDTCNSNDEKAFSVDFVENGNVPKSGHHALFNASDSAHRTAQCVEGNHPLKLTSTQTDAQQLERGLESITQGTCPLYIHGDCATSTSERSLNNANVGFSPDSVLDIASVTCESNTPASLDVIVHENPSDHGGLTGRDLRASALASSDCGKDDTSSLMDLELQSKTVRGNETIRNEDAISSHAIMDNYIDVGKVPTLEKSNTTRKIRNVGLGTKDWQNKDGKKGKSIRKNRSSTKISSTEALKFVSFSNDSSSIDPPELLLHTGPPKFGSGSEVLTSATKDVGMHGYDNMQGPFVTDIDNDKDSAFDSVESIRCKKKDGHGGKKGKAQNSHVKGKNKKKNIADNIVLDCGSYSLPAQLADLSESHMNKQSDLSPAAVLAFKNSAQSAAISTELPATVASKIDGASVPPQQRAAWVCCDDCRKWRRIPAELADIIEETNSRWTCKENGDKTLADCSIPQEKTNAEINAELELSDASADEADNDGSSKASRAPSWTPVRSNLFLHRNRRTQSIDESMVCNCKPPQDGRVGCRNDCLNRILNIECNKRTCPCGENCSNQQFQRRNNAKLSWFHSGKKGYGLQLKEDVSEGRFLIEYVGEVLDITSYESRQRYYASKGQKHFYFMALNGGEVIDASTKGNLGRFINHSCSPNCRTEKWMVNGEVCIGIFAVRNIKKGEELTFDYNYVRVSGAAPQKCFCGSAKCRGYIGGDISGADMIAQDDAEAGSIKSMAVDKDAEEVLAANGLSYDTNLDIVDHEASNKTEDSNDCPSATPELEPEQQTSGTLFDLSELENSLEASNPQDAEDVIRTPVHVSRTVESTLQQLPVYGTQSSGILQNTPYTLDGPKSSSTINGITPGSDLGSNLAPSLHANKKNNLKHHWNVKPSSTPIDNEHILGVEGRLNSLLDGNGGISKRKDATNGYLKLLFVTAAEGDNAGGTSKSVRDLSLILDALLKTKSRAVLLDIIDKNGLQMLHNILKQNRSNFHRIPIIRKLLKVLEFLASIEILTSEHINRGPRCAGMESLRDSMLSLTWHMDIQVMIHSYTNANMYDSQLLFLDICYVGSVR
ncbi:hypothetical protein GUJ93_ZPchr0006g44332 [Zizania palustris]|uniref:Histone-lysine N-methyltransferase n=1 Tax=Zizania palustris TaxID=103762 RepID=A0A8J5VT91_ZIZPA|nr:hypothetical protein GUJ93_ZPchr0006g44332 [Zizania palustris]